jgi:hypothetical protein
MRATSVRTHVFTGVRGGCADREPTAREPVVDPESEPEGIAGLRLQDVLHRNTVAIALGDPPSGPTDKAVDRVPPLRLRQVELVTLTVELVASVLQPFGHGIRTWPRPDVHIASGR